MSIEVLLLQEIEKHPCLYNFYLPEYNRKEVLEEAWSAVAANCDLTSAECKDKWKNIRSSFVRNIKLNGGKSKKPYYLSHYLQFVVPFLKTGADISTDDSQARQTEYSNESDEQDAPDLASIKSEPSIDIEGNIEELNYDPIKVEETPSIQESNRGVFLRKRRRMATIAKINSNNRSKNIPLKRDSSLINYKLENNAMRFFLMSLLPEFETMSDDQIRMFKIKVMMLIDDIKTQNTVKEDFKLDSERLQKRLINLLLKNLEHKT